MLSSKGRTKNSVMCDWISQTRERLKGNTVKWRVSLGLNFIYTLCTSHIFYNEHVKWTKNTKNISFLKNTELYCQKILVCTGQKIRLWEWYISSSKGYNISFYKREGRCREEWDVQVVNVWIDPRYCECFIVSVWILCLLSTLFWEAVKLLAHPSEPFQACF